MTAGCSAPTIGQPDRGKIGALRAGHRPRPAGRRADHRPLHPQRRSPTNTWRCCRLSPTRPAPPSTTRACTNRCRPLTAAITSCLTTASTRSGSPTRTGASSKPTGRPTSSPGAVKLKPTPTHDVTSSTWTPTGSESISPTCKAAAPRTAKPPCSPAAPRSFRWKPTCARSPWTAATTAAVDPARHHRTQSPGCPAR